MNLINKLAVVIFLLAPVVAVATSSDLVLLENGNDGLRVFDPRTEKSVLMLPKNEKIPKYVPEPIWSQDGDTYYFFSDWGQLNRLQWKVGAKPDMLPPFPKEIFFYSRSSPQSENTKPEFFQVMWVNLKSKALRFATTTEVNFGSAENNLADQLFIAKVYEISHDSSTWKLINKFDTSECHTDVHIEKACGYEVYGREIRYWKPTVTVYDRDNLGINTKGQEIGFRSSTYLSEKIFKIPLQIFYEVSVLDAGPDLMGPILVGKGKNQRAYLKRDTRISSLSLVGPYLLISASGDKTNQSLVIDLNTGKRAGEGRQLTGWIKRPSGL